MSSYPKLISEIVNGCTRLTSLSSRGGLNTRVRIHRLPQKHFWQVLNALQIKCVKQLKRKHKLLQLNLPIHSLEDAGSTSHSQISVLIGQIRSLHSYVTIVSKVEAVSCFISVTFLFWFVFDQNAYTRCYSQPLLQVSSI